MLRFASKLLLLHQMQWGIHSFTVGAYSRKKLTIIIECICDAMFVSMVPSVELEEGSKNVSWITVNQCLNCNKCVADSWLSLCLYHDPMEFTVAAGEGLGSARITDLGLLPLEEGLCLVSVFMDGAPLEEAVTCEKRELITALVQVITVAVTGFY